MAVEADILTHGVAERERAALTAFSVTSRAEAATRTPGGLAKSLTLLLFGYLSVLRCEQYLIEIIWRTKRELEKAPKGFRGLIAAPRRHCERSEAIHEPQRFLDCFASLLAMTEKLRYSIWLTPDHGRAPARQLDSSLSHGAKWKALINKYIGTIPVSDDPPREAEQSISGMPPPWTAVSSAMIAKVGAAARDSSLSALARGRPGRGETSGATKVIMSEIIAAHLHYLLQLPVPRSSECPAFRRGHWTMGRPSVR
jgi:hypothetical protein